MLEIEDLEKSFSNGAQATRVLNGISFQVNEGEYIAIMGTSGTGKTTLMNILGCLDKPTAGHYRLEGIDMVDLNDDALAHLRNHKIGFVFQQFHLLPRTSALKNVMLPLIYADDYPDDAEQRAQKVLESVGLADRADHSPSELSGGQQQRVAIARALVTNPALLLADEPTGNLDQNSGAEILAIFKQLHNQGHTIMVVTHDLATAEHADRIIILKDGRIAEDRKVERPRDAVMTPKANKGIGENEQ